tara:strand:- start:1042 stop:1404 length:363 start_codon:yes stop_codon:yes gene_type:complete
MKTVEIHRAKWARGKLNGDAALLNDDGNMCCLGFACQQLLGLTDDQMRHLGEPHEAINALHGHDDTVFTTFKEERSINQNNDFALEAMRINDSEQMEESLREINLTKLFLDNQLEITFED